MIWLQRFRMDSGSAVVALDEGRPEHHQLVGRLTAELVGNLVDDRFERFEATILKQPAADRNHVAGVKGPSSQQLQER